MEARTYAPRADWRCLGSSGRDRIRTHGPKSWIWMGWLAALDALLSGR